MFLWTTDMREKTQLITLYKCFTESKCVTGSIISRTVCLIGSKAVICGFRSRYCSIIMTRQVYCMLNRPALEINSEIPANTECCSSVTAGRYAKYAPSTHSAAAWLAAQTSAACQTEGASWPTQTPSMLQTTLQTCKINSGQPRTPQLQPSLLKQPRRLGPRGLSVCSRKHFYTPNRATLQQKGSRKGTLCLFVCF